MLQDMGAVKDKKVYSLPWLPSNCDKRLEYPIEMMIIAKAAYPDKFSDINLADWISEFYQNVYNVDEKGADTLISAQWLDWVVNN